MKPQHHLGRVENVEVKLETSDVNPGSVILTMSAGHIHFTTEMDPERWAAFMQACATIAVQANAELAAVALAEARRNPNCH